MFKNAKIIFKLNTRNHKIDVKLKMGLLGFSLGSELLKLLELKKKVSRNC